MRPASPKLSTTMALRPATLDSDRVDAAFIPAKRPCGDLLAGETADRDLVSRQASLGRRITGFFLLTKPRIVELLLITTLPTMLVAKGGVPSLTLVAATLGGGALAAGGANALNMVVDRDIDAIMKRTRKRPLVTGAVSVGEAVAFAIALEVAAFVELWQTVNLLSAVLAVSATLFYVCVYTIWLKRTSTQNIVIGGAAGAVPVLVGWTAVTGHLALAPLVLFSIIFLWTPPHFWALAVKYADDYRAAEVPMMPAVRSLASTARQILVYTAALWATSLLFFWVGHMGLTYLVSAAVLGAVFMGFATALLRDPAPRVAMRMFHYSIAYLTLLFIAMGADVIITHGL
jgi:protoheme IX farnesyltransferase